MGPMLKLAVVTLAVAGAAACGNSTTDGAQTTTVVSGTPPTPSASPAPTEEVLKTNFSGQVDLIAKTRKVDKDGDCIGTGRNADLKKGTPVVIRDARGQVVIGASLRPGTIIPLGDDGPQACRLPFSTATIEAVGRDFTAQVGDRKPFRFDVDDGMDIQIKVR